MHSFLDYLASIWINIDPNLRFSEKGDRQKSLESKLLFCVDSRDKLVLFLRICPNTLQKQIVESISLLKWANIGYL